MRLGEPAIPPELLVAVRREQLATQLAKAFIQEQAAQEKRVDSEKAKATADQQGNAVSIGNRRAALGAERAGGSQRGPGRARQADHDRRRPEEADGGARAPRRPCGCASSSWPLDKVFGFADKHPEVLTTALANAQKFVPNIQVGASEGGGIGGLLTALLGQALSTNTTPAATAGPSRADGNRRVPKLREVVPLRFPGGGVPTLTTTVTGVGKIVNQAASASSSAAAGVSTSSMSISLRSASRPRDRRERTVPIGTPRIKAASS